MIRTVCLAAIVLLVSGCAYFDKAPTTVEPWYPSVNISGDPVFAVFESRIPCSGECQRLKFGLALYRSRSTNAPTTYKMARVYVAEGNDRTMNEGTWTITGGTKFDPKAVVYQLDSNAPQEFSSFWAIGQDILFILDRDLSPRVGNAGYGYALNKTR